jgi:hypothetical protein
MRTCAWCAEPIAERARPESVFCGRKCRQRAWRLRMRRAELALRPLRARAPLRMAYADPPYPGLAKRCYGREASFAGEVDHRALVDRLATYDGWALSTGAWALPDLLPLCPRGARVCPWVKPLRRSQSHGPRGAWEPVIVVPGRRLAPGVADWLFAAPARLGGSKLVGRKPIAFCAWLFGLLGLLPGDRFDDLYPGAGGVSAAWAETCRGEALGDASPVDAARPVAHELASTRRASAAADRDASRGFHERPEGILLGRRVRTPLGAIAG